VLVFSYCKYKGHTVFFRGLSSQMMKENSNPLPFWSSSIFCALWWGLPGLDLPLLKVGAATVPQKTFVSHIVVNALWSQQRSQPWLFEVDFSTDSPGIQVHFWHSNINCFTCRRFGWRPEFRQTQHTQDQMLQILNVKGHKLLKCAGRYSLVTEPKRKNRECV
jgi:hypothetical protein